MHRLRIYKLNQGVTLIDDTFNANPHSVKAALDVLDAIGKEKTVAVLGSMAELGRQSQHGHVSVGKHAASKTRLNRLYTYGNEAREITRGAIAAGFPRENAIHSVQRKTLHRRIKSDLQPGCTILVKGSNIMGMNNTVKFIRNCSNKRKMYPA
jgi:UDP-N-acetylmuramoyl-tripeptide--D-alanyl-D-alanine ligase